jgi:hypothetical protein
MDAVIRFSDWCNQLLIYRNRNTKPAVTGTTRDFPPTDLAGQIFFGAGAAFILPYAGSTANPKIKDHCGQLHVAQPSREIQHCRRLPVRAAVAKVFSSGRRSRNAIEDSNGTWL